MPLIPRTIKICLFGSSILASVFFFSSPAPAHIIFKHFIHVDGQKIVCRACHTIDQAGTFSMPSHKICGSCHAEEVEATEKSVSTCGLCHGNFKAGDATPVTLRPEKPSQGIFFHSKGLEKRCRSCHGRMLDEAVAPGLIRSRTELDRIREDSHRAEGSEDCSLCHRDYSRATRPANHQAEGWASGGHRESPPSFSCKLCHEETTFCVKCHPLSKTPK